jgi:hypothetical protein
MLVIVVMVVIVVVPGHGCFTPSFRPSGPKAARAGIHIHHHSDKAPRLEYDRLVGMDSGIRFARPE